MSDIEVPERTLLDNMSTPQERYADAKDLKTVAAQQMALLGRFDTLVEGVANLAEQARRSAETPRRWWHRFSGNDIAGFIVILGAAAVLLAVIGMVLATNWFFAWGGYCEASIPGKAGAAWVKCP